MKLSLITSSLVTILVLTISCDFQETLQDQAIDKYNIEQGSRAPIKIPSSFNVYNINNPGTYVIQGNITGQFIQIDAPDVIIQGEGANPTFKGQDYPEKRFQSHIRGGSSTGSLTLKDFKIIGHVKHNCIRVHSNNTLLDNVTVINDTKEGAGAINAGPNSMIQNCLIKPHDDGLKITEPNSRARNCELVMDGNGAAIQLGWKEQCDGPIHYATNIKISGSLQRNKQTNTDDNPGRAIIGGIIKNNTSDVRLTGLDINMNSKHTGHYIKLHAIGATLKDVLIQGIIRNNVKVHSAIKPVALATSGGGKIQNITIDLGNKLSMADVYKGSDVTGLKLISNGDDDDDDDDNDDNDDNNDDDDDDDDDNHPADAVRLWADPDWKGAKALFTVGQYNQAAMVATGMKNNDAHSIKVIPGYKATLFTGSNFDGSSKVFTADANRLGGSFSNLVSSLIVEPVGDDDDDDNNDNDDNDNDDDNHPANAVRLWSDPDWKGTKALFTVGDYNQAAMVAAGMKNDDAHSIKVLPGYEATVYTGGNFDGNSRVFTTNANRIGTNFKNQVSSIKVRYIGN